MDVTSERDAADSRPELNLGTAREPVTMRARKQPYVLDELVTCITPENRHGEIQIGRSVGNEAW
jgi:antitoxin component of MazEF toxin-antitoxin module